MPSPHPDHATEARRFVRANLHGALSTLSRRLDGLPFGSVAPFAPDADGCPLLLISGLAEHTRNLQADPRCSLLAHPCAQDSQAAGRVTLAGRAVPLADAQAGQRYLRLLPEAGRHLDLGDFSFWKIEPQVVRLISGFGGIHWVDAVDYRIDGRAVAAAEDGLLDWLRHDPVLLRRLGAQGGAPHAVIDAVGVDPDGIDLRLDGHRLRLDFASVALEPEAARAAILALAGTQRR